MAHPFNFYIVPNFSDITPLSFICEASALSFLTLHSFDFNKLIYEAAPYANQDKLTKFSAKQNWINDSKDYDLKKDVIDKLKRVQEVISHVKSFPTELVFDIRHISVLGVKVLEAALEDTFHELKFEFSYDSELLGDRKQLIAKVSLKDEQQDLKRIKKINLSRHFLNIDNVTDPAGVASFISLMSQRNLPLVTHNGFGDLLHVAMLLPVLSSLHRQASSLSG